MAVLDQVITDKYAIYNGDSCEVLTTLPDNSIHLSVYSPPFATNEGGMYKYSSSESDLSNARDMDEFFEHYDFIIEQIYRLTIPGRMSAVHCMPVPTGNTGRDGFIDFPGEIIRAHVQCRKATCKASPRKRANGLCGHGWFEFVAPYYVWKEPLGVRNRLMIKGLAHKTIVDDSSRCSVAAADYLLAFRKVGNNPIPIAHPTGFSEYAGEREMPQELLQYKGWTGDQKENRYSHWIWRRYADSFWDDIRIERVLPYTAPRTQANPRGYLEETDEKHVHPLQLDVIDRTLHLWSNPGETVLTPFMGVGSEVYSAVRQGRRGVGVELKPSYYRQAVKNIAEAENEQETTQPEFDFENKVEQ